MAGMPNWLGPLVHAVAEAVTAHGPAGNLGLRYRRADEAWDVLVYLLPVEMVGGAHDGGVAAPGFSLDLSALRSAFTRVDGLGWDAHGTDEPNADSGPCVWVRGEFAEREVWLRVLAYAPGDEE